MSNVALDQAAARLGKVIDSLDCISVGTMRVTEQEVSFLCRWTDEEKWLAILETFLLKERGWESFIALRHFKKGKKMVAGWYLAFRSNDMAGVCEDISALLLQSASENGFNVRSSTSLETLSELVEQSTEELVPLAFTSGSDRNVPNAKGKGAQLIA